MHVQVENLSHIFPGRPPRPAIEGLSFNVPAGQFLAIVGPSGCGKSTLLRLAADLLRPTAGQIRLNGMAPAEAAQQRGVAWLAQSPALMPWLNARANVAMAARFLPNASPALTPEQALERVGLSDAAHVYPFMLSGGMQQRLALARALTLPAGLWLMDEPFAALDELTRERLSRELITLWQPPRPTVLWVTHHLHEALRLADRVLVLTPRPARLAADLPIDLPRPRDDTDPAFLHLLRRLRNALET
jgi:ABC-type nitrate/sulfonate/bicarbonate transport system ATPase subunit